MKKFLPVVLLLMTMNAAGQNLNSPNKVGPLGTQVNTLSGNLFISRTDISMPARGFDIDIRFYYNSYLYYEAYGYGKGWTFNYNIRYKADTLPGGKLILWGDGREDKYDSLPGGSYKTPRGFFSKLAQYSAGKFKVTEPDSVTYFFDNAVHKKITRMQEPNGNYIQFNYTGSSLTSLTNNAGQTISFTYDGTGRLASVVDAVASPTRTFTYKYDASGNLVEVKDPLNGTYKYTYLVNGPMKSLADKNNNKIDIIYFPDFSTRELVGCNKRLSFSYDTTQKKTVVTDHFDGGANQVTTYTYQRLDNLSWITSMTGNCCGFNMKFEYDDQGNKIRETDANGNVFVYTYDGTGNLLSATDPQGGKSIYTYSANFNKITSYKDPKGNIYSLEYDADGNMIKLNTPGNNTYTATYNSNGDIVGSTDPKGGVFTYNYDAYGNPTNVTGPNSYSANLSYDARGHLLSYTDARGNTHAAEYDILDRLKKITDPINNSLQYSYDAAGNLVSFKNKNNEASLLKYDASNRPVKITGPTGSVMEIGYDVMDKITRVKNPLGHQTEFAYDTRSRLSTIKDALGNTATLSYDGNGNVKSAGYPNGRTISYTYDKLDRLTKVTDGTGEMGSFTYDVNGNITSYKNGTGAIVTTDYDSLNRVKKQTDALGNSSTYGYDKNDNIVTVTDRNGFTSHYTYDGMNRVKTFTGNNGFVITVGYDVQGNVSQLTDQKGAITIYTYDELNRRKTMTYPDGTFHQYNYDNKNNLVSKRLTDGTTITYTYDTLNRMIAKTLPGGEVYSYGYDKLGRVVSTTNNAGTVNITYDALSRITSETYDGRTVYYQYNIAGRTQTTVYPDGTRVTKEFDTRSRLSRILKDSVLLVEYAYNNANQVTNKLWGNGVQTSLQYDIANRLSSLTTAGGSIQQLSYTYDKEGNKTAVNRLNNPSLSETFGYDNGYRLINHQRGATHNTYTYDAVGNRTAASINGLNTTYTVNNLNQLTAKNGINFTYDGRGNLAYDGNFYKTYDAEGRLMKDSSLASVVAYTYDAIGRRVIRTINGTPFKYTYSGAAQIEERNSANALLNKTVFTNFLSPVLNEKAGSSFYYHQNEIMSVEAITNSTGRLLESYRYDAYGKLQRYDSLNNPLASSIAGNRFGFTGQEWDSATGSYRFFFRNYSPETGAFNQRDLIEYEDGMGMYQYVGNNPANGVDVWGLEDCTDKNGSSWSGWTVTNNTFIGASVINGISNLTSTQYADKIGNPYVNKILLPVNVLMTAKQGANYASEFSDRTASANVEQGVELGLSMTGTGAAGVVAFAGGAAAAPVAATVGTVVIVAKVVDYGSEQYLENYYNVENEKYENEFRQYYAEMGRGRDFYEVRKQMEYKHWQYRNRKKCPPEGGTRLRPQYVWDPITGQLRLVWPIDPNEIVGPDGIQEKKFVSVKDQMNYTIRCENDTAASAPARYIKITTTIHPKHDPNTFQLGGFGLNNQTFEVPQGLTSYYQRLDCRDSMGLYVDVVAGYDQVANTVFWEFRGIDPLTLLPSEDPEKGILFLQDTAQTLYGHGFVTFSIRPKQTSVTLDTTAASANIEFDENLPIATNVWVNTIDAVAPISSMLAGLPSSTNAVIIPLQYSAADDANGSGFKAADLYISLNNAQPVLWITGFTGSDTSFVGLKGNTYTFFASALDKVNNREALKNIGSVTVRPGDCIGSDFVFTSNISGASYQWQVNDGTGFANLSNNAGYEGVISQTLVVKNTAGPMAGYRYRCNVNGTPSVADTLKFKNYWQGTVSTAWEDAANWSCGAVPNEYTDVIVEGEKPLYPVINSNPVIRTLTTNTGSSLIVRNGYKLVILK